MARGEGCWGLRDGAAPPGGARSGQLELHSSSRSRQRGSGGAYGRGPGRRPPWRGHRGAGGIRWSGRGGQGAGCEAKLAELQQNKRVSGRRAWQFFRELMVPKWSEAFRAAVWQATGSKRFTYVTAVTHLSGDRSEWEQNLRFRRAMMGNPVRLLSLSEIVSSILPRITKTPASSDLGRTLQLLRPRVPSTSYVGVRGQACESVISDLVDTWHSSGANLRSSQIGPSTLSGSLIGCSPGRHDAPTSAATSPKT